MSKDTNNPKVININDPKSTPGHYLFNKCYLKDNKLFIDSKITHDNATFINVTHLIVKSIKHNLNPDTLTMITLDQFPNIEFVEYPYEYKLLPDTILPKTLKHMIISINNISQIIIMIEQDMIHDIQIKFCCYSRDYQNYYDLRCRLKNLLNSKNIGVKVDYFD